jgi:hypothetical protein
MHNLEMEKVYEKNKTKLNYVVWVHELTLPTELLPLVVEVSANFCG